MDRGYRDLFRLIEDHGFAISNVDHKRGKGDHINVIAQYRGWSVSIISKPKRGSDPKSIVNFKSDLKRIKREIDGKATRSAGTPDHSNAGRSPGCIQIIGPTPPSGQGRKR